MRRLVLRRRVAPFGTDGRPPFALAGRDLLVIAHWMLQDYDTVTGSLKSERRVRAGAELEGTDGRLVVYTAGSAIHLVSGRNDRIVQTRARLPRGLRDNVQGLLHAALTARGLYYCFNVDDPRYPGARRLHTARRAPAVATRWS